MNTRATAIRIASHQVSAAMITRGLFLACATIMCASVLAGDLDRYRYSLVRGAEREVCVHLQKVLLKNFSFPWRRPALARLVESDSNYGQGSVFSFPKVPGVDHDTKATLLMSYSRYPTSPEFDAVDWREGRITGMPGEASGLHPVLVADIDIDNDGLKETVLKTAFMLQYYSGNGSGGEDVLYVLPQRSAPLAHPISWHEVISAGDQSNRIALIALSEDVPFRLIRPFVYEGTTYLMGYEQAYNGGNQLERFHVVKYRGGGYEQATKTRTRVKLERVCLFRMIVAK